MQVCYVNKDGGEYTVSFHEDDFEEAMLHAIHNGAKTVTDFETMETFDLRDNSKVEGIVHEGVHLNKKTDKKMFVFSRTSYLQAL